MLCVSFTQSEKLVISGSEQGAIAVANVQSGQLIRRLEHHRGMVTCIKVNSGDDIFATASTDCCVSIWSLDSFVLLNVIYLPKPIYHMDISSDSTFIMMACDDNRVHIRALTTGSDIHCLEKHTTSSIVTFCRFAEDSCRAVVGTGDGKLFVYDVHSAKLSQTLSAHSDMISAILTMPADRFLVTSGGNKLVIWNFCGKRLEAKHSLSGSTGSASVVVLGNSNASNLSSGNTSNQAQSTGNSGGQKQQAAGYQQYSRPPSKRIKKIDNHREPITCVAVSRDGSFAVTG